MDQLECPETMAKFAGLVRELYVELLEGLPPSALAAEMEALHDAIPLPYFVYSGAELADLDPSSFAMYLEADE